MTGQTTTRGPRLTRRSFAKAALATTGLGLGVGFGRAPAIAQGKRDMIYGMWGGDVGNMSPVIRYDTKAGILVYNIFDGLVRPNFETRAIEPFVAEDWTNPDPLTWRIKIREGVPWHGDYGEVTAEDVAYTWQAHLDTQSWQVNTALYPIDGFKTDGKYVLEVKLKQPFGAFPGVTMGYGGIIVPKNAHQEMGDAFGLAPVGNGPFMVDSVVGADVVLVRNPNYWREGPELDRIVARSIPDPSVRLQSLLNGELDFMTHPDPKDVPEVKENSDFVTHSGPGWTWDYQQFNLAASPDFPFHNKAVRQAISYAIDREALVNEIYHGEATVTDNPIPPGYLGHRESLLRYPKNGDLAKARELIAQAGISGYEVEVMTSDKDWLRRELELVAAMVSQIGINYKIRNLDIGSFNNLWINDNFQQHLEDITLVAPDPDATVHWFLHSEGSVSGGYANPEMDRLLDTARATTDPAEREPLYHQIVDLELEECPIIYHCNANYVRVHNKAITGFEPSPQEYVERLDTVKWSE